MINLELGKQHQETFEQLHMMAEHMMRPYSRKYDKQEHSVPVELQEVAKLLNGASPGSGASAGSKAEISQQDAAANQVRNGANLMTVTAYEAMSWGDVGLMLSIPGRGLGNAAIAAVGTPEQREKFGGRYAAMAITEPGTGSDSANISTTAVLDGDEWVINGEKIFVTAGGRCDVIVVWATLDKSLGKAAIKSFLVEKSAPGCEVARLEHKLGIRASDTAAVSFTDCRIPRENVLGNPEIATTAEERKQSFGGVMQTFDNTRPPVAAMAIGVARAALDLTREILDREGLELPYAQTPRNSSQLQAELYRMEAQWNAARLLVQKAAWMADNQQPNSQEASMCKAKAGRIGNAVTLKCVELCGSLGYAETELLEKFARDSKIIDIFEGTQQIQQLIVARRVLGKSSSELK